MTVYSAFLSSTNLVTDNRKVTPGCLFVALVGDKFDGNAFALDALAKGAAFAVVSDSEVASQDAKCLLVPDTLVALQELAKEHRLNFDIPVLGITGSNGKTTSKELINSVLSSKFNTHFTFGNLNNHIGVPLTLLGITPDTQFAIIEMGANHQGEIAELSEIACPSAGLINNIGKAHLEGFGGIEGVKKGKSELYRFLQKDKGLAFVNLDSEFLEELSVGVENRIFYGSANDDARLTYRFKLVASEPFIQVQFFYQNEWFTAASQLIGAYNYPNICNAIAIGLHYGVLPQQICEGIARYIPTNNRSQLIEYRGAQLIADCYNANPSSMQLALKNLAETTFDGQKFAVLGEMLEMGEYSKAEHSQLVQLAADSGLTHCLLVGKGYNEVETIAANMTRLNNAEEAKQWLEARDLAHSLVLIKGSRGNKLEIIFNNSNS